MNEELAACAEWPTSPAHENFLHDATPRRAHPHDQWGDGPCHAAALRERSLWRAVLLPPRRESRWYIPEEEPVAGQHAFLFPSVDELFAMIWHQLEQGAPIVDATYHPVYGYPVQVAIGLPHPDGVVVYQTSDFSAEVQVHASASGRHDRLK